MRDELEQQEQREHVRLAERLYFEHASGGMVAVVGLNLASSWIRERLSRKGRRYPLTPQEIELSRQMRADGVPVQVISARFGVSEAQVEKCVQGVVPFSGKVPT